MIQLPVLQNWDCTACGACCRQYTVAITAEERARIEAQGWDKEPDFANVKTIVESGWFKKVFRLNHRPTGECVFLGDNNRCRIHERFGESAKPLACRLYPFALIPAGNHWRVGMRFACPSAAANKGRPVAEHMPELTVYAHLLEKQEGREPSSQPVPPLQGRQAIDWPGIFRLVEALLGLLTNPADRIERRLRKCLAFAALCRTTKIDNLHGDRLSEFLNLITASFEDVAVDPATVPAPSWIGRVLFRQVAAVYARKDHGQLRGSAQRNRWSLFRAGVRFGLGRGRVPLVNSHMRPTAFAALEAPMGPLPVEAEAVLERYYRVKVQSLQFCGPTNFGLSFWEGFEALALTLPIILWLSRSFTHLPRTEAITTALYLVDDHFGYNRALSRSFHRFATQTLADRGELTKLIAWYSR